MMLGQTKEDQSIRLSSFSVKTGVAPADQTLKMLSHWKVLRKCRANPKASVSTWSATGYALPEGPVYIKYNPLQ